MMDSAGVRRGASLLVSLVVAAAIAGLVASGVLAAAGALDRSFSGDGKVMTPVGSVDDLPRRVAIDSHGRIVVAGLSSNSSGNYAISVVRYRPNGTLDPTFSGDGKVITPFGAHPDAEDVAIDSQDRIVVAGSVSDGSNRDFALLRYRPGGGLDTSFSGDGKKTTSFGTTDEAASAVAIDGQDRIVAGGYTGGEGGVFALARYRTGGSLDPGFSRDGKQRTRIKEGAEIQGLAIDSQNRIVAAGGAFDGVQSDFALARYRPNGSLDPAFQGGTVLTPIGSNNNVAADVAIDGQDRPVAAGRAREGSRDSFAVARYRTDGSLDPGFSHDGTTMTHFGTGSNSSQASGVAVDNRGRVIAAGFADAAGSFFDSDFALARYRLNGSLDAAFSGDGRKVTSFGTFGEGATGVAIDAQGRIVAGGYAATSSTQRKFAVARYLG